MKNPFATPIEERIEIAAKFHLHCLSEVKYHDLLAEYYWQERGKVDPSDTPEAAYRYAYLFSKWRDAQTDAVKHQHRAEDAKAKLDALCASSR